MPEFILYAYGAGLLVALVAGPLGSFVVWKDLSFFGHTLAHSALLGVALSLAVDIDPLGGIIGVGVIFSLFLMGMHSKREMSRETGLALLSHGALALSLVFISLFPEAQRYVPTYLFGDILALSLEDVGILGLVCIGTLVILILIWNPLLRITVHEGIARTEGTWVWRTHILFMFLLTLVISVSVKVLGGLLITALLIIPAVTARPLVSSPERMAMVSSFVGMGTIVLGMEGSLYFDTPPAGTIVVISLILFLLVRGITWSYHRLRG